MSGHAMGRDRPLHPIHALLLAFPLPLFLGALLSDIAYARSYHIQWANFASWLIVGGIVVGAFAVVWALIDLLRRRTRHALIYCVVLASMWVAAIFNALIHARDAWGAMPHGLYLSALTALLSAVAVWLGYSRNRTGDAP